MKTDPSSKKYKVYINVLKTYRTMIIIYIKQLRGSEKKIYHNNGYYSICLSCCLFFVLLWIINSYMNTSVTYITKITNFAINKFMITKAQYNIQAPAIVKIAMMKKSRIPLTLLTISASFFISSLLVKSKVK